MHIESRPRVPAQGSPRGLFPAFPLLTALLAASLAPDVPARLVSAIGDFDGTADYVLPAKLSQTGLYDNAASRTRAVTEGIVPFEVNSPLWSDGAYKERFITLPPGAKVTPTDTDHYAFPDKSVLVKNFHLDTVYGSAASRILIETRFLVIRMEGDKPVYHGITYKWRRDQSDADLVGRGGLDTVLAVRMGSKVRGKRWSYPSFIQCRSCHFGRGVLGFVTPQLNRPAQGNASLNQLQALFNANILAANPLAGKTGATFRWAGLGETGTSLELRSRSYFASNCSQCHGNRNFVEGAEHNFDFYRSGIRITGDTAGAYVGRETARAEGYPKVVYAGYPESSLVVMRLMARRDGWEMPPLASYQMDSAAVQVIKDWICSLGSRGAACKLPTVLPDSAYWDDATVATIGLARHGLPAAGSGRARLRLRGLELTVANATDIGKVGLYDFRGREIRLQPLGNGVYRLDATLPAGLYFVKTATGGRETVYLR